MLVKSLPKIWQKILFRLQHIRCLLYTSCDAQMMEITKAQMKLLEGRVPEKANEVVVSLSLIHI